MLIYLLIIYIKDFLKFPFVYNIAVIITFSYSTYNIIIFLFIITCLAKDFFKELEADF